MDEELADVDLAIFIDVHLVVLAEIGGIFQNFVDVLVNRRVEFEGEAEEGRVKVESVPDISGGGML